MYFYLTLQQWTIKGELKDFYSEFHPSLAINRLSYYTNYRTSTSTTAFLKCVVISYHNKNNSDKHVCVTQYMKGTLTQNTGSLQSNKLTTTSYVDNAHDYTATWKGNGKMLVNSGGTATTLPLIPQLNTIGIWHVMEGGNSFAKHACLMKLPTHCYEHYIWPSPPQSRMHVQTDKSTDTHETTV